MHTQTAASQARARDWDAAILTAVAVALTLVTAYIHSTLGGLLFTMNAIGYTVLAIGLAVPIGLAQRLRWLVRVGLLGFALTTIGGWVLFGARYDVAYFDKAVEVVLVGVLLWSIYRLDGGPTSVLERLRSLLAEPIATIRGSR